MFRVLGLGDFVNYRVELTSKPRKHRGGSLVCLFLRSRMGWHSKAASQ